MRRILFTWFGKNYRTTRYAEPDQLMILRFYTSDPEASEYEEVPAHSVQSRIYQMERYGDRIVESIRPIN